MAKRMNNHLQNTKHKTKDRVTPGVNSGALKEFAVPAPHVTPIMLL